MPTNTFLSRAAAGAAITVATLAFGVAHAAAKSPAVASSKVGALSTFGGAASDLSAVPALAGVTVGINVAGINSIGAFSFGNATSNFVTFVQLAPFAEVTGSSWNVTLTAFDPSWLSELQIVFTDSAIATGVINQPGFGRDTPGISQTFVGGGSLIPAELNFNVGADGLLRIEFAEGFDDPEVGIDGRWVSGNFTFEVSAVPEPGTYGLMALGMLGVMAAVRRRRAN